LLSNIYIEEGRLLWLQNKPAKYHAN